MATGVAEGCVALSTSEETRLDFWRSLRKLREKGTFCDVALFPRRDGDGGGDGEGGILCHSLVLAAISPTMLGLLSDSWAAGDGGPSAVFLPDLDRASVERFVDSVYSYLVREVDEDLADLVAGSGGVTEALKVDFSAVRLSVKAESGQVQEEEEEEQTDTLVDPAAWEGEDSDEVVERLKEGRKRKRKRLKKEGEEEEEEGATMPTVVHRTSQGRRGRRKLRKKDDELAEEDEARPLPPPPPPRPLSPLPDAADAYAQMVSGQGVLKVRMGQEPLDNAKLDRQISSRAVKFLALVGLRGGGGGDRDEEEKKKKTVEGLPLAWTPLDDDGAQSEGDRFSQYMNYCRALRAVLGLSEIEAHYQPHVMVSMGLGELLAQGSRTRLFAKRRHCDKTEGELRELLAQEDPDGQSEPGEARPAFAVGEQVEGLLELELSLAPAVDELRSVALLVFRSGSGPVEAHQLGFRHPQDRSRDAHYFLKTLCDVWALRRPDAKVERSDAIVKIFNDLRMRAEVCNVVRSFLLSGSARAEYASSFQSERQCPSCGRVFQIRNEREYRRYQYHCKTHYYRDHPCECPGLKFETARAKMAHVQLVHKSGFSKCPLCPHVSKTQFLSRHMEGVHGPDNACPHCGLREEGGADALLAHVRAEHLEEVRKAERAVNLDARKVFGGRKPDKRGPRPEVPSACDQCGRVYKNCSSLYKHMYSHSRFACKLCGFSTSALVKYREHMRVDHHKPLHYQPNARRYLW